MEGAFSPKEQSIRGVLEVAWIVMVSNILISCILFYRSVFESGRLLVSEWYSQCEGIAWLLYLDTHWVTVPVTRECPSLYHLSDHYVMTVDSVTPMTLMSNCDWTKELKCLWKGNETIKLSLTLLQYFDFTFLFVRGGGSQSSLPG